jgi:serine/threonine protein kinase
MELPENLALMSDREKMTLDAVRKEICALKLLKHPNIVRLYDVKKLHNVIYMVMELCNEKVIENQNKASPSQNSSKPPRISLNQKLGINLEKSSMASSIFVVKMSFTEM